MTAVAQNSDKGVPVRTVPIKAHRKDFFPPDFWKNHQNTMRLTPTASIPVSHTKSYYVGELDGKPKTVSSVGCFRDRDGALEVDWMGDLADTDFMSFTFDSQAIWSETDVDGFFSELTKVRYMMRFEDQEFQITAPHGLEGITIIECLNDVGRLASSSLTAVCLEIPHWSQVLVPRGMSSHQVLSYLPKLNKWLEALLAFRVKEIADKGKAQPVECLPSISAHL